MSTNKKTTANEVLLYVPNLIGYFRVICTLVSLLLMMAYPRFWLLATLLYIASFVGDLFGEYGNFCIGGIRVWVCRLLYLQSAILISHDT